MCACPVILLVHSKSPTFLDFHMPWFLMMLSYPREFFYTVQIWTQTFIEDTIIKIIFLNFIEVKNGFNVWKREKVVCCHSKSRLIPLDLGDQLVWTETSPTHFSHDRKKREIQILNFKIKIVSSVLSIFLKNWDLCN